MQWHLTSAEAGGISAGEIISILLCSVFLAAALWACLPKSTPQTGGEVFSRLLHRVHDRRRELFASYQGSPHFVSATRREFLNSVRDRLRNSAYFLHHRTA